MINAIEAIKAAQAFNRKCWLEHAGNELSNKIMTVAKRGIREFSVPFNELIKGAENLYEGGEMLYFLNDMLENAGFQHVITPEGVLIISW